MKTNKLIVFTAFLFLFCAMYSCNNKQKIYEATVYGTIVEKHTLEPVAGVQIQILDGRYSSFPNVIYSTISGLDGQYEASFNYSFLEYQWPGYWPVEFEVVAKADGYFATSSADFTIMSEESNEVRVDLLIDMGWK